VFFPGNFLALLCFYLLGEHYRLAAHEEVFVCFLYADVKKWTGIFWEFILSGTGNPETKVARFRQILELMLHLWLTISGVS